MLNQVFFTPFLGIDFYHTAYSFFFYGCACWFMECIFETIRQKRPVFDRGFNKGPICTIYGVAWLFIYFAMKPLDGRWLPLFLIGMLYATLLEYITGLVLEKVFHQTWWDYTDIPLNIQGRICLPISLAWGALAVLMFAWIQPCVMWLIDRIPVRVGFPVLKILICVYFIDLACSIIARSRLGGRIKDTMSDRREQIRVRFHRGR